MHKFLQLTVGKPKLFIAITALILGVLVSGNLFAAHAAGSKDGRLISIYDRGQEKVIVTKAATVEGALEQAHIQLDAQDNVEPTRGQKLVASTYRINVYRARPVLVVDGATQVRVMTADQSQTAIAKDAGMTLYREDTVTQENAIDTLRDTGVSMRLVVTRATPINVKLYGQTTTMRTQQKTVAGLLNEKGIKLTAADKVVPSANTSITANMNIEIWREGKQTITVNEDVPYGSQRIQDADQFLGYTAVRTPGVAGKRTVTYEIDIKNGQEVSRTEIQSVVTAQASDEVVVVGIKQRTADPASNQLLGHQLMLNAGFGEDQWPCLLALWNRESGWNQYKANYAGSGAYGIPQALPGSKMGPGWENDATVQINWGLGYIKGRYGTPCGADSFQRSKGWY